MAARGKGRQGRSGKSPGKPNAPEPRDGGAQGSDRSFAALMDRRRDVKQADPDGPEQAPRPNRVPDIDHPTPASTMRTRPHSETMGPESFRFPDRNQPLLAHRPSMKPRDWKRFRTGKIEPARKVELHGHRVEEARRWLADELREAHEGGEPCVLVVHGKGLHSKHGEAAIKRALPGWLMSAPLVHFVEAFAPAQPRHGGSGATLVALLD